jgi:hypothetical protein
MQKELGELLVFISRVAVSARMNTAYNRSSIDNPDTPRAATVKAINGKYNERYKRNIISRAIAQSYC